MSRYELAHPELLHSVQQRLHSSPGTLRLLSARSNLRAIFGILSDWLIIISCVIISERMNSWWVYLASVFIITTRINALYLEWLHEAVHGNLFTGKAWHQRLDFLYGLPILTTLEMTRERHFEHHRNYVSDAETSVADYSYWRVVAANWHRPGYRLWIWLIRPLLGYHIYTNVRDTFLDLYSSPRGFLRCLAFWIPLLALLFSTGKLHLLVWYWVVPCFIIHPPLFFWQDMAQHFNTRISAARDVRGILYNYVMTPHGRSAYHNLHHLYPGIPWFNIQRASQLLIDDRYIDSTDGFLGLSKQVFGPLLRQ